MRLASVLTPLDEHHLKLAAPLPFSLRNALRTIRPGAIGMGEWIATLAFVLARVRSF